MRDVALAILAGGEGSRMGFPKGELRLRGRAILPLLLERFDWPGPTLLVTAPGREHPTGWERFSSECVDPGAGQGPLRGVLTALENSPAPIVVIAAVDMPNVRREQLNWVADQLMGRPNTIGLMLQTAAVVEPFPSAFRTEGAAIVRQHLKNNRRSLHGLLADTSVVAVGAPPEWGPGLWANLNSPEDLDRMGR